MMRASLLAVLLVAIGVHHGTSTPAGGFGGFLAPKDSESNSPVTFPNPLVIPQKVFSTITGSKPGENHHHHQPRPSVAAPTAPAPTAAAPAKATVPPKAAAPTTTTTAPTSTSSRPVETADRINFPSSTSSPASNAAPSVSPTSAPTSTSVGNFTEEQLKSCRDKWVEVTNSTVNDNLDILTILLDHGGFPGQLEKTMKWERNATQGDPDRWTYFYGDTDYATYIRAEQGEIHSKQYPPQGATPERITGNIWWSPDDFCGKLRHAVYEQLRQPQCDGFDLREERGVCFLPTHTLTTYTILWPGSEATAHLCTDTVCDPNGDFKGAYNSSRITAVLASLDPELRASNQPEVCFIEKDAMTGQDKVTCWRNPDCVEPLAPGVVCPRGGVSGALMASLVG